MSPDARPNPLRANPGAAGSVHAWDSVVNPPSPDESHTRAHYRVDKAPVASLVSARADLVLLAGALQMPLNEAERFS
jgi:hypothetical protein